MKSPEAGVLSKLEILEHWMLSEKSYKIYSEYKFYKVELLLYRLLVRQKYVTYTYMEASGPGWN